MKVVQSIAVHVDSYTKNADKVEGGHSDVSSTVVQNSHTHAKIWRHRDIVGRVKKRTEAMNMKRHVLTLKEP